MKRTHDIRWWLVLVGSALAILTGALLLADGQGWQALLRFMAGFAGAWLAQLGIVALLRWRSGPARATAADFLTLGRMTVGTTLAGLVVAGLRDRLSLVGWSAWLAALLVASVFDWLDGPLSRRLGPTRLGGALDIEADSWLTLWCATAAMTWGGLPWWVVIAPVVRYIHPLRALMSGGLPSGGDPWWGLITGVAQMVLLLTALAPIVGSLRDHLLWFASLPISIGQTLTMLAQLGVRTPVPHPMPNFRESPRV
ncbi:MAG TPA: CDP-alcohol phosphatidyltransferase family protein [Ktedonobacterales bacterium]|nr:CDP-alcohol phosphatidyltransferase family protein [Ktedonobacterales bacterium]